MNSWQDRGPTTHIDGTLIFKTKQDTENEKAVASLVSEKFNCVTHAIADMSPVDWVFLRHGRVVGVGELKIHRGHFKEHPTAILNLRKWLALLLAGQGMAVPPIYVSQWSDWTGWVDVRKLDAHHVNVRMIRCKPRGTDSPSNYEPCIMIPLEQFQEVVPYGFKEMEARNKNELAEHLHTQHPIT